MKHNLIPTNGGVMTHRHWPEPLHSHPHGRPGASWQLARPFWGVSLPPQPMGPWPPWESLLHGDFSQALRGIVTWAYWYLYIYTIYIYIQYIYVYVHTIYIIYIHSIYIIYLYKYIIYIYNYNLMCINLLCLFHTPMDWLQPTIQETMLL
jgi:hypothetical protein